MKNLSITVAVTALIAFSLGYFVRGAVERTPNISNAPEKSTVREQSEDPATQAQTIVRADPTDANAPFTASLDRNAVITTTSSSPRASFVKFKSDMLGDFFLMNGIGSDRAEQIVQDLVDADHYMTQKANAIINQRSAENSEAIGRGDIVRISHTAEEETELSSERETLHRQVFGEFYEAYELYSLSYQQRRRVASFSSSLPEPLEYTAREFMVQAMHEENSRFAAELERVPPSRSGVRISSAKITPQERAAEKDRDQKYLIAQRSFNDRVTDRTRAYLTPSQFEQFKRLLDDDLRQTELIFEMAELETTD
jgi:hypothetical protein